MSEVRRDNKNRKLKGGEAQLLSGCYRYRYKDKDGKYHDVYSWRLTASDKCPNGKRYCEPLRDLEAEVEAALLEGLVCSGGEQSVVQLCTRYLGTKTGVRPTTRNGYQTVMKMLKQTPFGQKPISTIREIDAKEFLINLQQNEGKRYSSIHCVRGVLKPAFELAVKNDYIRKNPFNFPLADVLVDDSVRREAITRDQERRFLEFVKADKHFCKYYDGFYILFNTGLRISEFCGLTLQDIDMKNRMISVNHQLQRMQNGTLYVQDPASKKATTKTPSGVRKLPMTDGVYKAFQRIIANRPAVSNEPVVDGYSGFLFLDKNQKPTVGLHWEHYCQHIVAKHNKIYKEELPRITPHVCRHTYCNNMAQSGMNPKVLQCLMGHSDISVTLDVYTHFKVEDAKNELERLKIQGKLK